MDELIKIAKALSDRNRVRILKMLECKPLCVCEITSVLGLATSTVSSHLSLLRDVGLITDRKDGKWVEYQLKNGTKSLLSNQFMKLVGDALKDDEVILADIEKTQKADREIITSSTILKNIMK